MRTVNRDPKPLRTRGNRRDELRRRKCSFLSKFSKFSKFRCDIRNSRRWRSESSSRSCFQSKRGGNWGRRLKRGPLAIQIWRPWYINTCVGDGFEARWRRITPRQPTAGLEFRHSPWDAEFKNTDLVEVGARLHDLSTSEIQYSTTNALYYSPRFFTWSRIMKHRARRTPLKQWAEVGNPPRRCFIQRKLCGAPANHDLALRRPPDALMFSDLSVRYSIASSRTLVSFPASGKPPSWLWKCRDYSYLLEFSRARYSKETYSLYLGEIQLRPSQLAHSCCLTFCHHLQKVATPPIHEWIAPLVELIPFSSLSSRNKTQRGEQLSGT